MVLPRSNAALAEHGIGCSIGTRHDRVTLSGVIRSYLAPRQDLTTDERRWHSVLAAIGPLGAVVHGGLVPLYLALGVRVLALYNVGSVIAYLSAAALYRAGRTRLTLWCAMTELAVFAVVCTQQTGAGSGAQLPLFLIALLLAGPKLTRIDRWSWTVASIALLVALRTLGPPSVPSARRPSSLSSRQGRR